MGRADAGAAAEVTGAVGAAVGRSLVDDVTASLKKLDVSRAYMPKADLNALEAFLRKQIGSDGKTISPADIAPMYGMAWKPTVDGPDTKPADIAPMYGISWREPEVDGGDKPAPKPVDIAPMYGMSFGSILPGVN